ncbi:MAG: PAS-domain containing protein, partial [Alphaproteobacteria bacterium]|nr:PAS-domain containing protein [Alphaproteobacteria bacterium]
MSVGMADGARRRLLAPRILIVTVMLIAFLHGANAFFVYHFYSTTAAREAATRDATATMLAEQASQTFGAIDSALAATATRLKASMAIGTRGPIDQATLTDEGVRPPSVRALLVLGRDGTVVLDSSGYPPAPRALADQRYLAGFTSVSESGLCIGDLVSGAGVVPYFGMSRPIADEAGTRIGTVVAIVEPSYFAAMPGTLSNTMALLVHESDGTILAGTGIGTDTTVNQALVRYAHDILAIREVDGFPLQLIVAGPPVWMSPAFRNFLIFDSGIMAIVTVVAFWLAWRLAAEESARSTAEIRLHDAIESTPGGFALYDADDRLVLCNRTYVEYYTPPVQPLVVPGARFETIIRQVAETGGWADANDEKAREALIEQRVRAHRQATTEIVQRLSDGRWLLTRERRAADGGTACFYTDITRLKQQEEAIRRSERLERQAREIAERADRSKSSFLANMSHELRTPLNAVIGFSQIIEQGMFGPQPARYREYATLIRRSGEHLLTIINDILDIAKLQSGKTELRLEAAVLAPVIDEAVRL